MYKTVREGVTLAEVRVQLNDPDSIRVFLIFGVCDLPFLSFYKNV